MQNKIDIKRLSKDEMYRFIEENGLPRYRAGQLIHWIYKRYASEISEITEFSRDLRKRLNEGAFISSIRLVERLRSADGTEKFLFSLEDGQTIESVLIRADDRLTLCVSSQVGCAMGCLFCLTARCGLIRNLKAFEIVDQILAVNRMIQKESKYGKSGFRGNKISNIVFMGMGEPLANFNEVVKALWRIVEFIGISKRKITLSTAGIVPKMLLLPEKAPEINLAVSLNATTDEVRNKLMPVNKRYPIKSVVAACRRYPLRPERRITIEYVMISGLNDSADDASRLANLLKGIRCKVNLIPFNPHHGSELERPGDDRILEFQRILLSHNVRALIRESRGRDILAACGQLRAKSAEEF